MILDQCPVCKGLRYEETRMQPRDYGHYVLHFPLIQQPCMWCDGKGLVSREVVAVEPMQ